MDAQTTQVPWTSKMVEYIKALVDEVALISHTPLQVVHVPSGTHMGNSLAEDLDLSTYETAAVDLRIGSAVIMIVKGFSTGGADDPALLRTTGFVQKCLKTYIQGQAERESFSREIISNYEVINMLYRVSDALGSAQDMQRVTSIILDQAVAITQARRGSLLILNKEGTTLDVLASFGFDNEALAQRAVDLDDTICAEVMKTGKPLLVEDIKDRPDLSSFSKGNYQTGSFISLPLQVVRDDGEKEILGVLNLSDKLTSRCFKSNDARLLNALCAQASIAIANARILDDLRRSKEAQKKTLNELMGTYENLEKRAVIIEQVNKIAISINATLDLEKTFEKICLYAKNLTKAGDALVYYKGDPLSDAEDSIFVLSTGTGYRNIPQDCSRFFMEIMAVGSPRSMNQPGLTDAACLLLEDGCGLAVSNFLGVPFFSKGSCIGVVAVTDKYLGSEFSDEDRDIIKTLGNQAANAVQNARLIDEQKTLYFDTISALAAAVDAKDSYTHNHSRDVSTYARAIGEQMGLSEQDMELLQRAAVLHDIGKIAVPGSILNKPDRLTREEFETMKTHVLSGVKIVENISNMAAIIPAMRGHHERYDGKGYPEGLQGEVIPPMARILAVADTYDAITSDRPYRKGPGHDFAVAEIIRCSGSQFAPEVVEAFLKSSICANRQPEPVTKP